MLFSQDAPDAPRFTSVGRRMVTGVAQGEQLEGSTSMAYLKRIRSKSTNAFAYFGGFVGQGTLAVRLDNLPDDLNATNVHELLLEGEFDDDFIVSFNGVACGGLRAASGNVVQSFDLTACSGDLVSGNNTVTLTFPAGVTNASVSGGLVKVAYETATLQEGVSETVKTTWLPGIDGVINLYDGFSTPGTLTNLTLHLHYWVTGNATLPIYLDIGNTTVFTFNETGEHTYTFTDALLDAMFDYDSLSNTTVPLRLGFYDGNASEVSGNLSDVFLLTSRHNSMSENDIVVDAVTNRTRIAQAKIVDALSVGIILNATGNRVGLVSFGTGASVDLDSSLTIDDAALYAEIDGYAPHPTDAQRYLCGAMETAKAQLIATSSSSRKRVVMLMTDGDLLKESGNTARCDGSPTNNRALVWKDAVDQACEFSDPVHGNPQNITFYTIAFGPVAANDPAIVANLTRMAECTGGKFALGTNSSDLEEIYRQFAAELAASSVTYTFQRATSATNVESILYGDSYVRATFVPVTPPMGQYQIPVTLQTSQFGSCAPSVTIPGGLLVTSAQFVSYSGDYWTKRLSVDGAIVYNLSVYSSTYAGLGDPYLILVPADLLAPGTHTFNIAIGANATHEAGCSFNDSLIYTALVNGSTTRMPVLPVADGCAWSIEFDDGTWLNVTIPSDYAGNKSCVYSNAVVSYDSSDAYDAAVHALLERLDLDDDNRVFINLAAADLEIIVTLVEQVPYLWGPSLFSLEVRR